MTNMMRGTKRTRTLSFDVLAGRKLPEYQVKISREIAEAFAVPADMMRGMRRPSVPPDSDLMDAMSWMMELLIAPGCLRVEVEYDS